MGATAVYQLPYPAPADPADVPLDMQELAERIEAVVGPGSANGQVPIWDNAAKKWVAGSAELAYVEFTAQVVVTQTVEASATTIVTAPAQTFDGATPIVVEFFSPTINPSGTANQILILSLWDGGTQIGRIGLFGPGATATTLSVPARVERKLTPSSGSHTYSIRAHNAVAGSSSVWAGTGVGTANVPGFIRLRRA